MACVQPTPFEVDQTGQLAIRQINISGRCKHTYSLSKNNVVAFEVIHQI